MLGNVFVLAQASVADPAVAQAPVVPSVVGWFFAGLIVGAMFSALCGGVFVFARVMARRKQALILWTDGDSGGGKLEWVPRDGNEIVEEKGSKTKRFLLEGSARRNVVFGWWVGSFWEIHRRHGWNLEDPQVGSSIVEGVQVEVEKKTLLVPRPWTRYVPGLAAFTVFKVPTDAETVRVIPALERLSYSNPESYDHAIRTNEARDALEANREGDDWKLKLIPFAFAAVCLLVLMVGYIMVKMSTAGAHPAGG